MEIERVSPQELEAMMHDGKGVNVIDVRPGEAYEAAHAAGAINIPKDVISAACEGLSRGERYILY